MSHALRATCTFEGIASLTSRRCRLRLFQHPGDLPCERRDAWRQETVQRVDVVTQPGAQPIQAAPSPQERGQAARGGPKQPYGHGADGGGGS